MDTDTDAFLELTSRAIDVSRNPSLGCSHLASSLLSILDRSINDAGTRAPKDDNLRWRHVWRLFIDECAPHPAIVEWLWFGTSLDPTIAAIIYGRLMGPLRPHAAYRWIPVSDLPAPHNPFKCGYLDLFDAELQRLQKRDRRRRWVGLKPAPEMELRLLAGHRFRTRLVDSKMPNCANWHQDKDVDWSEVNRWTERALTQLQSTWSGPMLTSWIDTHVPPPLRIAVRSTFFDPIKTHDPREAVTNGQHRALALVRANVQRALVVSA